MLRISARKRLIIAAPLTIATMGAALLWWAQGMPAYTDPVRAAKILTDYDLSIAAWDAQMNPLRTAKWRIYETGFGLTMFAALFTFSMLRFRLWEPGSFRRVSTPRSKVAYLLLTVIVWFGFLPAIAMDFVNDHYREQVPLLDDAPERSLPLAVLPVLVLCGLSILSKLIAMRKVKFPVRLSQWDDAHPGYSRILTGIYGCWAGLLVIAAGLSGFGGGWVALPFAFGAYLVLCQRAVRLSSSRSDSQ
jgi:hypothetical protein